LDVVRELVSRVILDLAVLPAERTEKLIYIKVS
jgi:hypothetical protein